MAYFQDYYGRVGPGKSFKIAAFDFETEGLGGKVLFATYMMEGGNACSISGDNIVSRLYDVICSNPSFVWFAHNAQYDWRYFIALFKRGGIPVSFGLRTDNSIFTVRIGEKGGTQVVMRDSFAIWGSSLRDLADTFCPEFPKGNIDFDAGIIFDPSDSIHVLYALRDVEILVYGLRRFNDIILDKYGVNLGGTVAGTALRAWQRMLGKKERYYNPIKYEPFIRKAYFGGLVFLTTSRQIERAWTHDISSSYPHAMRKHGVPYGRISTTGVIRQGVPGIYDITVTAPPGLRVPILPYRYENGRERAVLWPSGRFRTTVTTVEIEFAQRHGYTVEKCHEGITFEGIIFPFGDFVDKAEAIRTSFKGKPEEKVAKLMQNSLYGKFGSRRERRKLLTWDECPDIEIDGKTEKDMAGLEPWDDEGDFFVRTEIATDMLCLPQWAVWITANARLALLRKIYEEVGVENVLYGDTDSFTCTTEIVSTEKGYGSWQLEKTWKTFRPIAPKVYAGRLSGEHKFGGKTFATGSWYGAAKGIPWEKTARRDNAGLEKEEAVLAQSERIFSTLYNGDVATVRLDVLPSFILALRQNGATLRGMDRRSTDPRNSRNWLLMEDGRVLPKPVGDY